MARKRLPLTALRSFEAAGRHQSFTLAAKELFVSQAAISRQIRDLEGTLGQKLFDRYAQRVELTDQGRQLLSVVSSAFDSLEKGIIDAELNSSHLEVSISVEPAFASSCLLPRLNCFQKEHQFIETDIQTDNRVIEFRSNEPTIAIRYAAVNSEWRNAQSKHLYDAEMIAVLSPKLLKASQSKLEEPKDFLQYRLLHEYGERDWQCWFKTANIVTDKANKGHRFDHMGLVLQSVLDGQGAAILDKNFAMDHLETGTLFQPFNISFKHGAYWVVTPDFSKLKEPEVLFVNWVLKEFR